MCALVRRSPHAIPTRSPPASLASDPRRSLQALQKLSPQAYPTSSPRTRSPQASPASVPERLFPTSAPHTNFPQGSLIFQENLGCSELTPKVLEIVGFGTLFGSGKGGSPFWASWETPQEPILASRREVPNLAHGGGDPAGGRHTSRAFPTIAFAHNHVLQSFPAAFPHKRFPAALLASVPDRCSFAYSVFLMVPFLVRGLDAHKHCLQALPTSDSHQQSHKLSLEAFPTSCPRKRSSGAFPARPSPRLLCAPSETLALCHGLVGGWDEPRQREKDTDSDDGATAMTRN